MKTLMLALMLVGASVPFCPQPTQAQAGQVLCCCNTYLGGQCCNFQTSCLGLVRGCICKF